MLRWNAPHAVNLITEWTSVPFIPKLHTCVARYNRHDQLMGGVFFTDYNVASVQIHVAAFQHNWLNRELLWTVFDLPFNVFNVRKLLGLVRSTNKRAIRLDLKLGFVLETTVKDVFPDGDMLVFSMLRENCRWLGMTPPTITFGGNNGKASPDA